MAVCIHISTRGLHLDVYTYHRHRTVFKGEFLNHVTLCRNKIILDKKVEGRGTSAICDKQMKKACGLCSVLNMYISTRCSFGRVYTDHRLKTFFNGGGGGANL